MSSSVKECGGSVCGGGRVHCGPVFSGVLVLALGKIQHPWTNVVTVKGQSPFMAEHNDGVVTVASQKYHADMELVEVDYNHYEVVLAEPVIKIIKERIKKFKK